jgi:hypothetical protein
MGDSEYSFSLTTFSPSGKLVQIEYALNAVAAGSTSLGIKATNGVVIATEKKVCFLQTPCCPGSASALGARTKPDSSRCGYQHHSTRNSVADAREPLSTIEDP